MVGTAILVAYHGAAMALFMFLPKGAAIIEVTYTILMRLLTNHKRSPSDCLCFTASHQQQQPQP